MKFNAIPKCATLAAVTFCSTSQCFSEAIPRIQVTTLTQQSVTLPETGSTKPILLVLGFSNKSSDDMTNWNKHFKIPYASDSRVNYMELADFQGVPPFVMKMVLHGMRKSVKEPEKSHFAPFYAQEDQWKQLVKFDNSKITYIVLANAKGEVIWQTRGPASDAAAAALGSEVDKLVSAQK